tara:strand:+ start:1054 stop:1929 length:876 start_codon:yes stop_codon:yes gene_type:complete
MIIHGDAVEGLKSLETESVDCFLIDPPYNIGKDFGNNKRKQETKEYVEWCMLWYNECKRALKPSGTIFIYGFPEILAHLSVNIDLEHRWLQWHYTNKTVPRANFWQRTHESILCIWKDRSKRVFNKDDVREPYTEAFVKGYSGKNKDGTDKVVKRPPTAGRFGKAEQTAYKVNERGALPRDVIKVSALAGGSGRKERFFYSPSTDKLYTSKQIKEQEIKDGISHPTQKPIELTEKLLKSCRVDNFNVVIPFSGTGSEAYVCDRNGYNWLSYELNKDYVRMGELLVKDGFPK